MARVIFTPWATRTTRANQGNREARSHACSLARRNGTITILAVAAEHRRHHVGTALCEHAFDAMRNRGAEVVEIGTGGDPFHAPARALYERLGCTQLPVAVYYRQL